jgi:hypothetical protein
VVASTKIYGYESGKAEDTFKTRPDVFRASYRLVQRARADAKRIDWLKRLDDNRRNDKPTVFIGPIAAGEKVVASTRSSTCVFLREAYGDALAVEMEGKGFLEATTSSSIDAIVIRGISDLVDKKGVADASGSQELAACHASAFAMEMLAKLGENQASILTPNDSAHVPERSRSATSDDRSPEVGSTNDVAKVFRYISRSKLRSLEQASAVPASQRSLRDQLEHVLASLRREGSLAEIEKRNANFITGKVRCVEYLMKGVAIWIAVWEHSVLLLGGSSAYLNFGYWCRFICTGIRR